MMTGEGLYCPAGDFYLDPWRPVPRAVITHGHSDHARAGHGAYLTHPETAAILQHRLGVGPVSGAAAATSHSFALEPGLRADGHSISRPAAAVQTLDYGKPLRINGVQLSFYPAGHIPGSAQVLVEHQGDRWVFSGDYFCQGPESSWKREGAVRFCTPFEPVNCRVFITESTFGLPVYRWPDPADEFAALHRWWADNQRAGRCAVLIGYSLGKAQRLLSALDAQQGMLYAHGAVLAMTELIRGLGYALPPLLPIRDGMRGTDFAGSLVLAPPSAIDSPWMKRLEPYSLAFTSGWMRIRGPRRRHAADRGFVLSDHADWDGLNAAVRATGAERVLVTHGFAEPFSRWLCEQGLDAAPLKTRFEGESGEIREGSSGEEGPSPEPHFPDQEQLGQDLSADDPMLHHSSAPNSPE
jgi:putative mRNA 3-end processing factor